MRSTPFLFYCKEGWKITLFFKSKRKHCRAGALLLLAGLVLTGTAPATGEPSGIQTGSLVAFASELDIESIEAMQRDGPNTDASAESESSFTDEKLDSVLAQIQASLPSSNGDWSVYVCDLKTGAEGRINDHRMQAASLIKLYIMGAVYENYDRLVSQYGPDTIDANLYSMITVSDNDAANALTTYLGDGNSSAGMQIVNDYCLAHGYTTTHMGRLLLHSNEFGDNYTSVSNCGAFLKMVYWEGYQKEAAPENSQTENMSVEAESESAQAETSVESADGDAASEDSQTESVTECADGDATSENSQAESATESANGDAASEDSQTESMTEAASSDTALTPHASDMFALLCAQTRRHKIPAQLPEGVHTANKTGELDDVENDAAILYDTANDLIIVFMSEHLGDCGAAQSTIASLSRAIYDAYQ